MAIAERFLSQMFNRDGLKIVDHHTYVLASDGDMMEGVASEAASLAGHLKLGKLIVLYDDNKISLAAPTEVCFTEDVKGRFRSYGWQVLGVVDGNTDIEGIRNALSEARSDTERPTLIAIRTTIGYGSPGKANTSGIHGSPLGAEETKKTKENLGWPLEPVFHIPDDVLEYYRSAAERGKKQESEWKKTFDRFNTKYPELAKLWDMLWSNQRSDKGVTPSHRWLCRPCPVYKHIYERD
jgi:transketolase